MKTAYVYCCLLLLGAAFGTNAAEVRLRSSVTPSAPIVRLADVAEIFADDPAIAEGLGLVSLCPAPATGRQRTIGQHELRQMLVQSGVARESVLLTGSERVTVISGSQPLVSRTVPKAYDAEVIQQAAFANEESTRSKPQSAPEPPPVAEQAGAPRLINRGAVVTVYARTTGVQVRASGKALSNGVAGEIISVELDETREKVQARVVGPHTVEVAVGRSTAANRAISVPMTEPES